jgi:hypothetical protein
MDKTEGKSETPRRGMLPLSTWKATKPFRAGILGISEEVMKIRDKLPLADPTRMNDSPSLPHATGVDSNHRMGAASKLRKGATPTNSKALTMSVMRGDMLTDEPEGRRHHAHHDRHEHEEGIRQGYGAPSQAYPTRYRYPGESHTHGCERPPTRAAMTNTESVITTVNAKVVYGGGTRYGPPLVTGTGGLSSSIIDMKVLRLRVHGRNEDSDGTLGFERFTWRARL